jgi:hypothetical protein
MSYPDNTNTQTVTVAAGASLSGASTKISGQRLVGVMTASTWDAAKLTFQVSSDGTNYADLYSETAEYEVASVTGAAAVALDPAKFVGWDYVKVRSGTSGAATNQADATIVTLVFMLF